MNGFRNFILRGNLVDLAVAVIIGTAFGAVVTSFVAWLTDQLPDSASKVFHNDPKSFGAFLNAVISFVILAAVVYFLIVVPYTKVKEKYFPSPEPGQSVEALLGDIKEILAAK